MTLPSNSRVSTKYTANGTNKDFAYNFRVFYSSDTGTYGIEVRKVVEGGYEIVSPALYEVIPDDSTLIGGKIRYFTAPDAGTELYVAGKTPKVQQLNLANYGRFSAESIEANFDFMMAIIQEWLSSLDEERAQRIANDLLVNENTAALYANWQSWAETNVPVFAETFLTAELAGFKQQWIDALNQITLTSIPAVSVPTANGQNQQEINNSIGAKWFNKFDGYAVNDRVALDNGDVVVSTAPNNTNDPNSNMTGWILDRSDTRVKTWSGRTQESKNKDVVSPLDFGALRGRANAAVNTTAFNLMATFVQIYRDTKVDLLGGTWFLDGTFTVPDYAIYEGHGTAYWQVTSPKDGSGYVDLAATQIVMVANAANKVHTIHGISSMAASGGVIANPSARVGFNEAEYKLESFTGTNHQPVPFSVACKIGKGARLNGVRVFPDGGGDDGLDLYRIIDGDGSTAWAADWDVGLWSDAVSGVQLNDAQFVGHWRKTGKLITSISSDVNVVSTAYNNTFTNCVFTGYKPVIVRAADTFKIVAIGSNYVDVQFAADHPFNVATYPYVWLHKNSFSGNRYDLISVTENGATTRLTLGSNPTSLGYAVGSGACSRAYGGGSSQNQFSACQFSGLNHASKYVCNDQRLGAKAFGASGGAIEISGYRVVEILFDDKCSWQSYENVFMHIHDAHHTVWIGWVEVNSDADSNQGARVIASPTMTQNSRVTNPSGYTNGLHLDLRSTFINKLNGDSSSGLDLRPHYDFNSGNVFANALDTGFATANFINIPHALWLESVHTNVGIRTPKNKYGGFYDNGSNLKFAYNGATDTIENRVSIVPNSNLAHNLGSTDHRFNTVYTRLVNAGDSYNVNGTKVVGVRQAAIANAAAGTEIARINSILTALRNHGLIEL